MLGRHRGKYECIVTSSPGGNDQRIAILSVTGEFCTVSSLELVEH